MVGLLRLISWKTNTPHQEVLLPTIVRVLLYQKSFHDIGNSGRPIEES